MLLVCDVVDVLDFLIILIDNFSFIFIIFFKTVKMSEQIIALKAEKSLLQSQLKDKDDTISARDRRIGGLEKELAQARKYELVLSVRSRIEFLEEFLDVPTHDAVTGKHVIRRLDRWLMYFDTKKDELANELKRRIEDAGSTVDMFCKSINTLYGDFSDRAAHRIPLPEVITETDIDEVLKLIGVFKDKPTKIAVQILITPLDGQEKKDSSSSDISYTA